MTKRICKNTIKKGRLSQYVMLRFILLICCMMAPLLLWISSRAGDLNIKKVMFDYWIIQRWHRHQCRHRLPQTQRSPQQTLLFWHCGLPQILFFKLFPRVTAEYINKPKTYIKLYFCSRANPSQSVVRTTKAIMVMDRQLCSWRKIRKKLTADPDQKIWVCEIWSPQSAWWTTL